MSELLLPSPTIIETDEMSLMRAPPPPVHSSIIKAEDRRSLSEKFNSVVQVFVTRVNLDYARPWTTLKQSSATGTGFCLNNRLIMTNAHVVRDNLQIRIKKHGSPKKYHSKCIAINYLYDLALCVIVEHVDEFWTTVRPVVFATELPWLQSVISVIGYPAGSAGKTVCVTEGVVSRVYVNSSGLLDIQVDSPINPGNSGGPCFNPEGEVVGVAARHNPAYTLVGFIIPSCLCTTFLDAALSLLDLSDRAACSQRPMVVLEVATPPFFVDSLENKSLARFLKLSEDSSGVVVTRVLAQATDNHLKYLQSTSTTSTVEATAMAKSDKENETAHSSFLVKNDVITHIDGKVVGSDFTVCLREGELVSATYLMTCKIPSSETHLTLLRNGVQMDITTVLLPLKPVVPRQFVQSSKQWLIIGGFQFQAMSCPLLNSRTASGKTSKGRGPSVKYTSKYLQTQDSPKELILLVDIMAAELNDGYRKSSGTSVLRICNGHKVVNMLHLYHIWKQAQVNKDEYMIFETHKKKRFVLETHLILEAQSQICEKHGVPSIVSDYIKSEYTRRSVNMEELEAEFAVVAAEEEDEDEENQDEDD